METGIARKEEWPRLRELWQGAFGDGAAFIDDFFVRYGAPDRLLTLREGGRPVSMLALLPMEGVTAEGERFKLPYVYALATDPEARGKGYAGKLLAYAADRARALGAAGICTVPAQPSLHRFFASAGYGECFATRRWEGRPVGEGERGRLVPVGPEEYARIREKLLRGIPHGAWDGEMISIQEGFSGSSGGGLFRLELGDCVGCAALERWPEKMVAKEMLAPARELERAEKLLTGAFPASDWELRAPAALTEKGALWAFGMADWFDAGPAGAFGEKAYLGLAFD